MGAAKLAATLTGDIERNNGLMLPRARLTLIWFPTNILTTLTNYVLSITVVTVDAVEAGV